MTLVPEELVPGDILELPRSGLIMDVDAVLLSGNCIVNESMLTGMCDPINPANQITHIHFRLALT